MQKLNFQNKKLRIGTYNIRNSTGKKNYYKKL